MYLLDILGVCSEEEHFFLFLRLYLIRQRVDLALLSPQMCFGQNMKEKIYPVKGLYSLGYLFNSHSVITFNPVFARLLLAFPAPIISINISVTECVLFLLNKTLVQKETPKCPGDIHSQWWHCIRTPGADWLDPAYLFLHI